MREEQQLGSQPLSPHRSAPKRTWAVVLSILIQIKLKAFKTPSIQRKPFQGWGFTVSDGHSLPTQDGTHQRCERVVLTNVTTACTCLLHTHGKEKELATEGDIPAVSVQNMTW